MCRHSQYTPKVSLCSQDLKNVKRAKRCAINRRVRVESNKPGEWGVRETEETAFRFRSLNILIFFFCLRLTFDFFFLLQFLFSNNLCDTR